LMPLDYSLWKQVDEEMLACDPRGRETKAGFLARLKRCARSLPKATVRATVRRMRANLDALVESKGFTPKND
jgi:hypothetical protein